MEPVPEKEGRPIPKSEWPRRRRHCWIVRWCGTNRKKYGKLFKTRKEAERHALDLQNRINLGRPDKPQKITLQGFRLEHEQVMKGQVAYATLDDQKRVLKFFENFIGGSFLLSKIKSRHAEYSFPYIFISQQRLKRIRERQKVGTWTPRSQIINNLDRNFRVLRCKAGVDECVMHDLRRSAITNWAKKLPIQVVKEVTDTSSTRACRPFGHLYNEEILPICTAGRLGFCKQVFE